MTMGSYYIDLLNELNVFSTIIRLLLAMIFGGVIGINRGRMHRAAGLRTHMLVCVGATLVMITNQYICLEFQTGDPSRLGAQVISGIGFLGVGTIIVDNKQQVKGLTTAAGLWACACMGLALGIGFYSGAIIACIFVSLTVIILNNLDKSISNKSRIKDLYLEFEEYNCINEFVGFLSSRKIKVIQIEMVQSHYKTSENSKLAATIITIKLPRRVSLETILYEIYSYPQVVIIEKVK